MQIIPEAISADGGIKVFRSILGSTRTQAVQAQGILIVFAILAILAAGIHFTEYQLPVIAFFFFVVVYGTTTAKVFHFHAQVFITGDDDGITVTFPSLVDGVGEDLKHCVLTAFQVIRAENNRRAFADTLLILQHGNTAVAVLFLSFCCHNFYLPNFII